MPVQAHSAALGLAFYPEKLGGEGAHPFPREYSRDAFLAFHGSWNRSAKTGYKIARVHFQNGQPVEVSDFLRGFLKEGGAWGRPVDVQVAPDGALLVSDDGGGIIWRIVYEGAGNGGQIRLLQSASTRSEFVRTRSVSAGVFSVATRCEYSQIAAIVFARRSQRLVPSASTSLYFLSWISTRIPAFFRFWRFS